MRNRNWELGTEKWETTIGKFKMAIATWGLGIGTGKLRIALKYLEKALAIEFKLSTEQQSSIADTHLNVCAVLSQLGRHEEALEHVLMSIVLL